MLIGYARVSTLGQSLDVQRAELKAAGVEKLFEEKASGAKADRVELGRVLEHLRAGDVLVVAKLDRLARSTVDLLTIADKLKAAGVGLRSLGEPWADTTSPAGHLVLTVLAGVAEFERARILERTSAGREVAKAAGVKFGRPAALSPAQVTHARELVAGGASIRKAAGIVGVHHKTLSRALEA